MTHKQIHYVMAILREGSITGAAKKLYLSQPSLSQALQSVEKELGALIFERDGNRLRLTLAGEKYIEAMRQIDIIENNLQNELAEIKHEPQGQLRLGITVQRGMTLLPLIIPEFVRQYPHVKLKLVEYGSDMLERRVIEGECDLAMVTTSAKSNELTYILMQNEQLVLMAARTTELAQRFADGQEIGIFEAANEAFVQVVPGHSVRVLQDRLFEMHNLSPRILLETNSLEVAKNVAARSNALMLCPYIYVSHSKELLELTKCFPISTQGYERHFYVCYRKGLYFTGYMEGFLKILRSKL